MLTHGHFRNKKRSLEYVAWSGLRARCNNKNNPDYQKYGGRGLSVSKEWDSFEQFLLDMGPKPTPQHSIDRIDNNKGYSKENCRWANSTTQNRNRRDNKTVEYQGRVYRSLAELAEATKCTYKNLSYRLLKGWTLEDAIMKPAMKTYNRIVSVR